MRRAQEEQVWADLTKKHGSDEPAVVAFGRVELDLAPPCTVVGGRNGSGKSRLLRSVRDHLGAKGLLLDLHSLCEQALTVLRSREDFDEMSEEFEILGPDEHRRNDIERIIGREYDSVDWYALEVEPSDEAIAERFRWGGEQTVVPYFDVAHRGIRYSSRDMGLGEFSVHILFWILEQYRGETGLTLLLDEPDAYLPPIGASALLSRLLRICLDRGWRLIIATHSAEIIRDALEHESFVILRKEQAETVANHCRDDKSVADVLLERPPMRQVFFVEDESAWILATVLIETLDRRLARSSGVVWGNGSGYMVELQSHFPKPPVPGVSYVYLFDGDQRKLVKKSKSGRWPALFLPTNDDPDDLFKTSRDHVDDLALRLNVPIEELKAFLDSVEAFDPHDWVNDLGDRYGRQRVLRTLAESWVERHSGAVDSFLAELSTAIAFES